jgi:putative ABC transport system permease protein
MTTPFAGLAWDLRLGVRRLLRRPGFTLVALLTCAVGIGANTAVFSLVRSILWRPLPYADPERLVVLWNRSGDQTQDTWMSAREVVEYPRATAAFVSLAGYTGFDATLVEGEPERVHAAQVTGNLFGTLGVPALLGRTLFPADDVPGSDNVAVLGHDLWQRHLGGAPDVVGKWVRVNGQLRMVVGVMPAGFQLPLDYREARPTEIWVPAAIVPSASLPWGDRSYFIVGRLNPGLSPQAATADLERAHAAWMVYPEMQKGAGVERAVFRVEDLLLRRVRPALWILFGAVALLLLIACANVAHLLLARADERRREVATQAALGASPFRLARQLLAESGLLALAGAFAGVLMAHAVLGTVLALTPVNVIRMKGVALDETVLVFTALLALGTTLAAGLVPALQVSSARAAGALAAARGEGASLRLGTRRFLVAGQAALAVLLVLGATLLARSYAELRRVPLGFRPSGVLTVRVDVPRADYPEPARVVQLHRELVQRVAALPGVRAAGAVRALPLAGTIGEWSVTLDQRVRLPGDNPSADWQIVVPGYFEALGITAVEGRLLTPADDEKAPLVCVISQAMAERYWSGTSALGQRLHLGTKNQPWMEVVGVARHVRHNAVVEDPRAEMYIPHAQFVRAKDGGSPVFGMTVVARTEGDPRRLLDGIRAELKALDPRLPLSDVRTLDEVVDAALAEPRFTTLLLGGFAVLALALAALGLYGVISFVTARRTREIGVRVALGARPGAVCGLVVRDGLWTTAVGLLAGLVCALWATRLLASQLYGVGRLDPWSFVGAPLVLLAVAALAAGLPARRAAQADPMAALRQE